MPAEKTLKYVTRMMTAADHTPDVYKTCSMYDLVPLVTPL